MSPLVLVLENPTAPIVSRDGRILYEKASHQTDLYVQDVDGSNQQRLALVNSMLLRSLELSRGASQFCPFTQRQ